MRSVSSTTGKRLISLWVVFLLALNSFSVSVYAEPLTRTSVVPKTFADGDPESFITPETADEVLAYIRTIDTNQGRADFRIFSDNLQKKKDRLYKVQKNLAYRIAANYRFQSAVTSSIADGNFPEALPATVERSEVVILDLIRYMERSAQTGQAILRAIAKAKEVGYLLSKKDIFDRGSDLDDQLALENQMIDKLSQAGDPRFYPLLSELFLSRQSTLFLRQYVQVGHTLLSQLNFYTDRSTDLLAEKTAKEEFIPSLVATLYPSDSDKSTPLDDPAYFLLSTYAQEDIDRKLATFTNSFLLSEKILSFSADTMQTMPANTFEYRIFLDRFSQWETDEIPSDDMEAFYTFLSDSHQEDLTESSVFLNQYELLKTFNDLLNFTDPAAFDEDMAGISELHSLVASFQEGLERRIQEALEEEAQGAGAEEEAVDQESAPPEEGDQPSDQEGQPTEEEAPESGEEQETVPPDEGGQPIEEEEVPESGEGQEGDQESVEPSLGSSSDGLEEEVSPADSGAADQEKKGENTPPQDNRPPNPSDNRPQEAGSNGEGGVLARLDSDAGSASQVSDIFKNIDNEPLSSSDLTGSVGDITDGNENPDENNQPTADSENVIGDDDSVEPTVESNANEQNSGETEAEAVNGAPTLPENNGIQNSDHSNAPVGGPPQEGEPQISPPAQPPVIDTGQPPEIEGGEPPEDGGELPTPDDFISDEIIPAIFEPEIVEAPSIPESPAPPEPIPTEMPEEEGALPLSLLFSLFQEDSTILDTVTLVSDLIANNPDIVQTVQAIDQFESDGQLALLAQRILDQVVGPSIGLDEFILELEVLDVTENDLDELTGFLNRFFVEFGYISPTPQFRGIHGVLRFGSEDCPNLLQNSFRSNYEHNYFPFLSVSDQQAIQLIEKENEKNSDFARLKQLAELGANFCLRSSTDIATTNLIGRPEFFRRTAENYSIDQSGSMIRFDSNLTRDVELQFPISGHTFVLRHDSSDTISPADGEETPTESYRLSALENPEQMFTPLTVYQEEFFRQAVTYESDSHRKNEVYLVEDSDHLITPRRIGQYFIYNYGDGHETESITFENAVLHQREDGAIEGYFVGAAPDSQNEEGDTSAESERFSSIHFNGLPQADFVLSPPFALTADSQLAAEFSYSIEGEHFNRLVMTVGVSPEAYPVALHSKLFFTLPDQVYFDSVFEPNFTAANEHFGHAQTVGDFNGDGRDDLAVGTYPAAGKNGKVYLFTPSAGDFSSFVDQVIAGTGAGYFGYSLQSGDFNGDGRDDLAVGEPLSENGRGMVYIFYGKENFFSAKNPENADVIIKGASSLGQFGFEMTTGDFNHDGKADLAVSAPQGPSGQGRVYLFYNDAILRSADPFPNPFSSDEADVIIEGDAQNDGRFGHAMAIGDLDDDGRDDLIVGAPFFDVLDSENAGRVYVFLQGEILFHKEPACQKKCVVSSVDMVFDGESDGGYFGGSLLSADFDEDSKDDLVVGSSGAGPEGVGRGRVDLYFQAGQMKDALSCESPCPIDIADSDVKLIGALGENFGFDLFATDADQDSHTDLLVGATSVNGGHVHIFYGGLNGIQPTVSAQGVAESDFHHDIQWEGDLLGDFGQSFAVGDLNGDAIRDVLVGSPAYRRNKGRVYVFYGQLPVTETETEAETEEGTPSDETEGAEEEGSTPETTEETTIPPITGEAETTAEGEAAQPEAGEEEVPAPELDTSPPTPPVITCDGFESGVFSDQRSARCRWTDTAGPSAGIYRYCVDNASDCEPSIFNPERYVELTDLGEHHTYLRVQTEDLGGQSGVVTFDIAVNHPPDLLAGPSDGGSDQTNPTREGTDINFSASAQDVEQDPYHLLICRTSDSPVYRDGAPDCAGIPENRYCLSSLTASGERASCRYDTAEESSQASIWYAFLCDAYEGEGDCSQAYQGEGVNGSPIFIQHPARFGVVTTTNLLGQPIEPGNRIRFSLPSNQLKDIPDKANVTLYICSEDTLGFDYQKNQCEGGTLICASAPIDVGQGEIICAESEDTAPLVPIPSPPESRSFKVFVEHGQKGLVDGAHRQSYAITNTPPSLVSYTNEGTILVPGGGSEAVAFSAIVEDLNGSQDIQAVEGIFFDSDSVWNNCTPDRNDCYTDSSCDLTIIDDTHVRADCSVEIFYNANASEFWKVHINPTDTSGKTMNLGDSDENRTVPPLISINQEEIAIPFNATSPGLVSETTEVMLTNLGNQPVDVLVGGTDLTGAQYTLAHSLQKWSLIPDFDYEQEGYPLVITPETGKGPVQGCAPVHLPVHDNGEGGVSMYWKIYIPKNQKADDYSGTVSFTPVPQECAERNPVVTLLQNLDAIYGNDDFDISGELLENLSP